jgi:MFS family permease
MFFSVFALFLDSINFSVKDIGIIDGVVEGACYLFKVISGVVSDHLTNKRAVFAFGTLLITLSRVIVAMSAAHFAAILAKVMDRLGNGVQSTPRDAIVGDCSPKHRRGLCFSVRQALGTFGSVAGAFFAIALLKYRQDDFRAVFVAAGVPAAVALFIILFKICNTHSSTQTSASTKAAPEMVGNGAVEEKNKNSNNFSFKSIKQLDKNFWLLISAIAIFMMCRYSETIIILYGKTRFNLGSNKALWAMPVYNIAWVLSAYVVGPIVDRSRFKNLMLIGAGFVVFSNLIFITASSFAVFLVGVALWGVQLGLTQTLFCTWVTHFSPKRLRGTAFGVYYLVTAIGVLLASTVSGTLMHSYGSAAFIYSAAVGAVSMVMSIVIDRLVQGHTLYE